LLFGETLRGEGSSIYPLRLSKRGHYNASMTTRREKIEAMLADDPQDAFLRYSLAMELQKEGDHERCVAIFRELAAERPPHVASCFRLGQLLASLGQIEPARSALRDGIEAAREQGDAHAAGEMSEFLASLGALGE
jgi:tetratricopeptide (TPR) repeat protein